MDWGFAITIGAGITLGHAFTFIGRNVYRAACARYLPPGTLPQDWYK